MKLGMYTTVAVGPDGRIYNLSVAGFPKREDYIAVNAYTVLVKP